MMKRFLILAMMLCAYIMAVPAQTKKEQKAAEKQLKQQVSAYTKEGWIVPPGHLPLSEQLSRSYSMQKELDEEGFPKYVPGEGMSVGSNYDAAKMQALELAKLDLAQKLQAEITALVANDLANEQTGAEEAESVAKTVLTSKSFIQQRLSRVITLVECYRTLSNKNKEVRIIICCNSNVAFDAAKAEVKKQLENRLNTLHKELDNKLSDQ